MAESKLEAADHIWFKHPERVWALGRIDGREGESYRCVDVDTGDVFVVPPEETHSCDPTHLENQEDIARMNNMHEGPLLHLLKLRYMNDEIYTFTGDILISLNPYIRGGVFDKVYHIPDDLYDYENDRHPHVYAVADKAYRCMMGALDPSKRNQSLIVSGESGAGKTEGCKCVMRYLASISERYVKMVRRRSSAARVNEATVKIEKQVLDCNPFLEAFGNAKTVRNDNSSRFGKFLKIQYDGGRIMGADMEHYLLEKARVVQPCLDERNYHIFYQLIKGATPEETKSLELRPAEDFVYIRDVTEVDHMDDAREFAEVRESMTSVGIMPDTQAKLWEVLAGLLHLGNVEFDNEGGDSPAEVTNKEVCAVAERLLGADHLDSKLVTRMVNVQGRQSCYVVQLTPKQAEGARDALAKAVYEKMFGWLVSCVNTTLSAKKAMSGFIGILDIFGFEIFETNSFEQLCINFANEKLQSLFNHHVFVSEQEQYKAEGVDMSEVAFVNNKPCVELIEKSPYGILVMLDEVCRLGRELDDTKLLDNMDKQHRGKHKHYIQKRPRRHPEFGVAHFAGTVTYNVVGFIEKNNDTLFPDLLMLMQMSKMPFMREIFSERKKEESKSSAGGRKGSTGKKKRRGRRGGGGGRKAVSTIASKFRSQLKDLNNTILATTPHYVRCIKPNKLKAAHNFDTNMILGQLLYSGVLETVRIRRMGYPFRETYVDFWRRCCANRWRYMVPEARVLPEAPPADYDESGRDRAVNDGVLRSSKAGALAVCGALLEAKLWTTGRTKIFMKGQALDVIVGRFRVVNARKLVAWSRGVFTRWHFVRYRRAIVHLQKRWRAFLMRRKFAVVERQVTVLQAHVRRRQQRAKYLRLRKARAQSGTIVLRSVQMNYHRRRYLRCRKGTVVLQAILRMRIGRRRYLVLRAGFTRLQAVYRANRARAWMGREKSVILIQSVFRGHKARKRVARLRAVKITGCVSIQAAWRRYYWQNKYARLRHGTQMAQRLWRGKVGRRRHLGMKLALREIKSFLLMCIFRKRFLAIRLGVARAQALWRGHRCRKALRRERNAARILEAFFTHQAMSTRLGEWTQELHAACTWGDAAEVEALLDCAEPRFMRLRSVPPMQRTRIRNRNDGLKSVLHSAAASGDVATVRLLVDRGAEIDVVDLFGATPLHNSSALGDSRLGVTQELVRRAPPKGRKEFLDRANLADETALDVAVLSHRDSPGTHGKTVAFLQANGAATSFGDEAAAAAASDASTDGAAVEPEMLIVAQAERREKEVLQRRKRERLSDPHYQFLFVAAEEKKRHAAEAAARAERERRASQVEAARRVVDRERMLAEEEYSRLRELRDKEADRLAAQQRAIEDRARLELERARRREQQEADRLLQEAQARAAAEKAAAEAAARAAAEAEKAARMRKEQETLERLALERQERLKREEEAASRRLAEEERRRQERKRRREEAQAAKEAAERLAMEERAKRREQARRDREERRKSASRDHESSPATSHADPRVGSAAVAASSGAGLGRSAGTAVHTHQHSGEPRSPAGSAGQVGTPRSRPGASSAGGGPAATRVDKAGSRSAAADVHRGMGAAKHPQALSGHAISAAHAERGAMARSHHRGPDAAARGHDAALARGMHGMHGMHGHDGSSSSSSSGMPATRGGHAGTNGRSLGADAAATGARPDPMAASGSGHGHAGATGGDRSHEPTGIRKAPSGLAVDEPMGLAVDEAWEELESEDGLLYYHNLVTGETTWDVPPVLAATVQAEVQTIDGEEWEELEAENGLLYYHSLTKGTVQWTPPAGFVVQEVDGDADASDGHSSDGGRADGDDWDVLSTDSGHEYYYNRATKVTTWERPAELGEPSDDDVEESVGRSGWVSVRGPDGVLYHHNEFTGVTQRDRPEDF